MIQKTKKWTTLRHYTSVGWLKTILKNDRLKFSNAQEQSVIDNWDDQNDVYVLRHYYQWYHQNPLVCCFTHSNSIHHWEYYGKTSPKETQEDKAKCCIVFDYAQFQSLIEKKQRAGMNLKMKPVTYYSLKSLQNTIITKEQLPFVKKYGFNVDQEERLIWLVDESVGHDFFLTEVVECIKSVTLYTKNTTSDELIKTIKSDLIKICPKLQKHINTSALCNSPEWQKQITKSTIKSS